MEKKTILMIEDDLEVCTVLKDYLSSKGYAVILAHDGLTGIQECRLQVFDAIITDIRMPKMEGNHAVEAIKDSTLNKQTPVIVLSGTLNVDLLQIMKRHISRAFTKPVDFDKLEGALQELIK